ncbi:MAG: ATP-binding protein [Polyangia bacterium]
MPHEHGYLWTRSLLGAQVGSNLLLGLSYVAIAMTLVALIRRARALPLSSMYICFGIFLLSCGLMHWLDVVTVWRPILWADAGVRVLTALTAACAAALFAWNLQPAVEVADSARLLLERGRKLEAVVAELVDAHRLLAEREKDAQRRAELSTEQSRSLVETMPQLAWITDPEGKNLFRNQRWSEYTGLSLEELNEKGWEVVQDPELLAQVVAQWQQSLKTRERFEAETRIRRADGEYRWFLARATPVLDKSGAVTSWVGTCTDIHDQHLQREQALHNARMKDEFIATISHELRTPLNAILGWSKVLQSDGPFSPMHDKALGAIERNAVAQAHLIEDLLDASRIISGKMQIDVSLVDPADPVESAVESVRPTVVAKELQIEADICRSAGLILADAGRIQQIVWNLLANSVKFTPRGGKVAVKLTKIDSQIEILVTDSGVGISPAFLPHIFDRFSQEDASIRRKHGGLGLGLAIARDLVELHGGKIRAHSPGEGLGSTFVVTLPIAAGSTIPKKRSSLRPGNTHIVVFEGPPELKELRLLLLDDDADSREMAGTVLTRCGVKVTGASSVIEALALLEQAEFDVILSDIGMPVQDGYSFIQTVRKKERLARVPAAAMTAYASAADRTRALTAGFQMHLPKPVEPSELIAVIANLARMAQALQG